MSRADDTALYPHVVEALLERRGLTEKSTIEQFLNPDYDRDTHDPFLLADIHTAVARILRAIENNEHIVIYADFDCDGIPASVVLHDFFKKIEYENFEVYIPHRHNDGYGFHTDAIDTLAQKGAQLIITVDVGIVACDAAAHAKELGVDVIVTDHHELGETLPNAVAVINPKREGYPFPDLCGAAVAFKLVQALLVEGKKQKLKAFDAVSDGWEKWLLDMVGIATVADMVPLVDENRALAHFGLKVLRKSSRPGIVALCQKLRINQTTITEDDIGFLIAPRVNAASRMDESEVAFALLSTDNPGVAEECVRTLEKLNRSRKALVASLVREVNRKVSEQSEQASGVIVTGDPKWKPAFLGLAANSVMGDRGGAVCLWGRDGKGEIKGSCRSDGSVRVVDLFQKAGDVLTEYGGHACAGGFSVSHEHVHALPEAFAKAAQSLRDDSDQADKEVTEPDTMIHVRDVSWDLWRAISALAPFGVGNPKPVLTIKEAHVHDVKLFGKEQNHTEVSIGDGTTRSVRAFQFFVSPDAFTRPPSPGNVLEVLAHLDRDTFRGPQSVALRLVDIR